MSAHIHPVTEQSFEQEVREASQSQAVLVDFWAEWCGPCRMVAPVLEQLAQEQQGRLKIVKLNVDEHPQTAAAFGVRSIPTLILFKDGQPAATRIGAAPRAELAAFVAPHLAVA